MTDKPIHPIRGMIRDKHQEWQRLIAQQAADRTALWTLSDTISPSLMSWLDETVIKHYAPTIRQLQHDMDLLEQLYAALTQPEVQA